LNNDKTIIVWRNKHKYGIIPLNHPIENKKQFLKELKQRHPQNTYYLLPEKHSFLHIIYEYEDN